MGRESATLQTSFEAGRLVAELERFRAEARCANELERHHVLWRLGQKMGINEAVLLREGFDEAYRRIVEEG